MSHTVWADGGVWNTVYSDSYDYHGYSSMRSSGSGGRSSAVISIDLDPQNLLNTSLRIATRERRLEDVKRLLEQGAEVDGVSDRGETAVMIAARGCSQQLVQLLIEKKANINLTDTFGRTALILAARESCMPVVQNLLKTAGIQLNGLDRSKKSAMDYARENAMLEVGGPAEEITHLLYAARARRFRTMVF